MEKNKPKERGDGVRKVFLCVLALLIQLSDAVLAESLIVHHYMGDVTAEAARFNEEQDDIYVVSVRDKRILMPDTVFSMLRDGQDIVDVFVLNSAQVGFDDLIAAQLSPIEETEVPLFVRQKLECNGILQAWPVKVEIDRTMSYAVSVSVLKKKGIDEKALTENLLELIEQISAWYADGTLADVRLLEDDDQRELLREITLSYVKYVCCSGDMSAMDWEYLAQLLNAGEILLAEMKTANCMSSALPCLLSLCTAEDYLTDSINTGIKEGLDGRQILRFDEPMVYLQCVPAEGMSPLIPVTLVVGLVNPQTSKRVQAQEYLQVAQAYQQGVSALILCQQEDAAMAPMRKRYASVESYMVMLSESYECWANQSTVQVALNDLVAGSISVEQFIQIVR